MTTLSTALTETLFSEHRQFLWGLCYRLTGNAADADDIMQDTFVRAMERPPADRAAPWRPWLVRVALNLGRDVLRRRKRRGYVGPWLPSPIDTGDEVSPPSYEPTFAGGMSTERRYDLLESVTFAFLIALEALSPRQRAILLLRDVFDYSVQDTAAALDLSEANVKTSLHRARRAMHAYDQSRCLPTRTLQQQTRHALDGFLQGLFSRDINKLESLLVADTRLVSDGGGEFRAALKPIVGCDKILRFHMKAVEHARPLARIVVRMCNGLPALVFEYADSRPGEATRFVYTANVDREGRITELHAVLASRKLTGVLLG